LKATTGAGKGSRSRTTTTPTLRTAAMAKRGSKDLEVGKHKAMLTVLKQSSTGD
jgi:hypothetical protein